METQPGNPVDDRRENRRREGMDRSRRYYQIRTHDGDVRLRLPSSAWIWKGFSRVEQPWEDLRRKCCQENHRRKVTREYPQKSIRIVDMNPVTGRQDIDGNALV